MKANSSANGLVRLYISALTGCFRTLSLNQTFTTFGINMIIRLLILIAITLSSSNVFAQDSTTESAAVVEVKEESPIVIGTTLKIQSAVMASVRELNIWLPPTYNAKENSEKKFHVLYVIDGGLEQDFQHISGLSQLASINNNYHPMIVVGIKTEVRFDELTQQPTDPRFIQTPAQGGKSALFMDHLSTEVIPLIEKRYRTSQRRTVIGESLAGLFIAEVFLRRPEMFTDYISISPSMWWDGRALAKESAALIAKHDDKPRKLYLTIADERGTMRSGLEMMMDSIKANKPKGLEWSFVDRKETESHSTIYHGAAHDALRKLFGIPVAKYTGPLPWHLTEDGKPDDEELKEEDQAKTKDN